MEQEPFGSRCSQCDALLPEDNAFDYVCERCVKDVRDGLDERTMAVTERTANRGGRRPTRRL